jgi:hypothetical protein
MPARPPGRDAPAPGTPLRDPAGRASPIAREAAAAAPRERSAPGSAIEPAAGVRIGSIEVHVLPEPERAKPETPRPQAGPRAAQTAPLARGLTSPIGLRQS